jgi:MFS family permease
MRVCTETMAAKPTPGSRGWLVTGAMGVGRGARVPAPILSAADPTSATLQSLATLALAFLARPIGSVIFGHLGDRFGRKCTLIATLLTVGISILAIGLLPTYGQIGVAAPVLLALCRLGRRAGNHAPVHRLGNS